MSSKIKYKISDIQNLKNSKTPFCTITVYDYASSLIINELNIPFLKPPSVHALIKLSKYIPDGIVKPEILFPGSLKAKNKIEKNGYKTIIEPIKKIE